MTYKILEQDTYSIVTDKVPEGKTFCGLCSRLRRGILYNYAESIGANKIALGHHCDDIVETLFLNMFYGGKLKAMPPKLLSDDRRNIVIRPLAYCKEAEISRYAELVDFRLFPAICAVRRTICSARPLKTCCRAGSESILAGSKRYSEQSVMCHPVSLRTQSCLILQDLKAYAQQKRQILI